MLSRKGGGQRGNGSPCTPKYRQVRVWEVGRKHKGPHRCGRGPQKEVSDGEGAPKRRWTVRQAIKMTLESQPRTEMGHLGKLTCGSETSPEVYAYSVDGLDRKRNEGNASLIACDILHFFLSQGNVSLVLFNPKHRFYPLPGKAWKPQERCSCGY